jgi:hypothetical protein
VDGSYFSCLSCVGVLKNVIAIFMCMWYNPLSQWKFQPPSRDGLITAQVKVKLSLRLTKYHSMKRHSLLN